MHVTVSIMQQLNFISFIGTSIKHPWDHSTNVSQTNFTSLKSLIVPAPDILHPDRDQRVQRDHHDHKARVFSLKNVRSRRLLSDHVKLSLN